MSQSSRNGEATPSPTTFAQRLRSGAAFLAANYAALTADEAQVLVRKLESAADHVEAYSSQSERRPTFSDAVIRAAHWVKENRFACADETILMADAILGTGGPRAANEAVARAASKEAPPEPAKAAPASKPMPMHMPMPMHRGHGGHR